MFGPISNNLSLPYFGVTQKTWADCILTNEQYVKSRAQKLNVYDQL